MKYLLWQWRRFRLALMMHGMSPEQRRDILNQAILEAKLELLKVKLEQYSQSLRRQK